MTHLQGRSLCASRLLIPDWQAGAIAELTMPIGWRLSVTLAKLTIHQE